MKTSPEPRPDRRAVLRRLANLTQRMVAWLAEHPEGQVGEDPCAST